jgi:hypothetical protein
MRQSRRFVVGPILASVVAAAAAYAAVRPQPRVIERVVTEASATRPAAHSAAGSLTQQIIQALASKQAQQVLQAATLKDLLTKQAQQTLQVTTLKDLLTKQAQQTLQVTTLKDLLTKQAQQTLQASAVKGLNTLQQQQILASTISKQLQTPQDQQLINSATVTALAAPQSQPALRDQITNLASTQITNQLQAANTTTLLKNTLGLASYTQGKAAIITGRLDVHQPATPPTLLTIPGLLHVTVIWWPSDGTAVFRVVNDSSTTLDYGSADAGFPYTDIFPTSATKFGELSGLSAAYGAIAPGGQQDFTITPGPDNVDLASQTVPYRAMTQVQVTSPAAVATLNMSTFVVNQAVGPNSEALFSGQAIVGSL